MKNKPTEKQPIEDQIVSTKDLFKFLKEKLSPSCPEIKETTKEEEKLHFIYKQFHDNPYYGPIFKEIYLGYFSEQDLNDSPSGLIFSENLASMKDDELDLLYNYYIKSVVHWILVLCTENQVIETDCNENDEQISNDLMANEDIKEKDEVISNDPKGNEENKDEHEPEQISNDPKTIEDNKEKNEVISNDPKSNDDKKDQQEPEETAIDFVYNFIFNNIKIDDYYKDTIDLLTLMKSLPQKDTMRNFKLLRVLLKEKDTEKIRTQIALFSSLGIDFTKTYLKEISLPNSINGLMFIVKKILILISLPKDNLKKGIDIINNNFPTRSTKTELISKYKIEYYFNENKKQEDKIDLLQSQINLIMGEIKTLKTENVTQNDEIKTLKTENVTQNNSIENLQKQIDSICLRDQLNNGIDFFTTTPLLNPNTAFPSISSFESYLKYEATLPPKEKDNYQDFLEAIKCFLQVKQNYNVVVHNTRLPFFSSFKNAYDLLSPEKQKKITPKCIHTIENISSIKEFNTYIGMTEYKENNNNTFNTFYRAYKQIKEKETKENETNK